MAPLARPIGELVSSIRAAVEAAGTLPDALAAVAAELSGGFPIVRLSVRLVVAPDMLAIAGVWTPRETALKAGTRIPARSSSLLDPGIREGRAVVFSMPEHESLLEQILRDEGIRSWVTVGLRDDEGELAGLLSFSSDRPAAFIDADVELFEALGAGLEGKLLSLARRSGTL